MEDDEFKKLIEASSLDEPASSFTDHIMKIIEGEQALGLNPGLLSILKSELLEEPFFEFSDNLMEKIQPKANKGLEPVIYKKIGLVIFLGVGILVFFFVMTNYHPFLKHVQNGSYFSGFKLNFPVTTMGIIKIATSILPYLIPLSILLFLDYFIRTRQRPFISRE